MTKIYTTTRQSGHGLIVELRTTEDQSGGFIGVRKAWDFDDMAMQPAEVVFSIAFNYGNELTGYQPAYARRIERVIRSAVILCDTLDYHIRGWEDFKRDISVRVSDGGSVLVKVGW